MNVTVNLRVGSHTASFNFDPERQHWEKQKFPPSKYLKNYETGLTPPFATVFIKRVYGGRASAHKLLLELLGQSIPGMPMVFGYARDSHTHLYFLQNLSDNY